jgi:sugar O-acyltransferase (sialic acid O-acetyltransferase NeuD family)
LNYYIFGAGGHGKVVLDAMRLSNLKCDGFIDDKSITEWSGLAVFKTDMFKNHPNQNIVLHIAIGNVQVRERISKELTEFSFLSVSHPSAIVSATAKIEEGSFLAAGAIVGPDAKIGKHCIINHLAVIDHDCAVGDFCHIAPHASLGGGVQVGLGVLVGAGAIILPGISIGNYAIIGAGAIVTKNVEPNTTVIGNPAHPSI